jgi:predicted dehydrogenase
MPATKTGGEDVMKVLRVAIIGAGWMGRAHATAFRTVPMVFGREPATPVLEVVADVNENAARALASEFGFARSTADWRDVLADPDVDVVDITTPNDLHPVIAIAAAEAGKHVYCEKPLANSAREARAMTEAVERAGVVSLVGFNYLKNPGQGFARAIIDRGEIGTVNVFRGTFDQDFMSDPDVPFSWRQDRAIAGSGALGDMASHTLSFSQYLVGDIDEVCGMTGTFITERQVAAGGSGHSARADAAAPRRPVENEDVVQFLIRYTSGAMGVIEASRIGTGRKLWLTYEIQGSRGALFYTQERMNEIQLYRHTEPAAERGYKTVFIGPEHPGYGAFFPIPGIGLGYNDQKIIEARDLVVAIATGKKAFPDFRFGLGINRVVDAVLKSVEERRWVKIEEIA